MAGFGEKRNRTALASISILPLLMLSMHSYNSNRVTIVYEFTIPKTRSIILILIMTVATVLSHVCYQATMVLWRMIALLLWAQIHVMWNMVKCMPTVWSTLWAVAMRVGGGLFLNTCSLVYHVSNVSMQYVINLYRPILEHMWMCHRETCMVYGIVGVIIIVAFDHFDQFDKRTRRVIAIHQILVERGLLVPAPDMEERMVPIQGAFDYGRAHELNRADDTNSEECAQVPSLQSTH
jgi:hypothetical protein